MEVIVALRAKYHDEEEEIACDFIAVPRVGDRLFLEWTDEDGYRFAEAVVETVTHFCAKEGMPAWVSIDANRICGFCYSPDHAEGACKTP